MDYEISLIPKALRDSDCDNDDAGNDAQSMGDRKLPKTSSENSGSDVVTGDSDTISQSSVIDVSTTAASTAG